MLSAGLLSNSAYTSLGQWDSELPVTAPEASSGLTQPPPYWRGQLVGAGTPWPLSHAWGHPWGQRPPLLNHPCDAP